jgi:UPF0716 family protein affecting phage T7 exclusion
MLKKEKQCFKSALLLFLVPIIMAKPGFLYPYLTFIIIIPTTADSAAEKYNDNCNNNNYPYPIESKSTAEKASFFL